jgi:hypothetical protein
MWRYSAVRRCSGIINRFLELKLWALAGKKEKGRKEKNAKQTFFFVSG